MRLAWITAGAVVLVTLVGGAVLLKADEPGEAHPTEGASSPATTSSAATDLSTPTEQDATRFETALSSSDPTEVSSVFTSAVTDAFAGTNAAVLPEGSTVLVDIEAFTGSADGGTLPLTVQGPEPGSWLLLVVVEDGQWRAYGTSPRE